MSAQISKSTSKEQFAGIQYLRGLAAVVVILDHVTVMSQLTKYFGPAYSILGNFFSSGFVGVELFFVISGFIIVYVSLKGKTLERKITPSDFFLHRFTRIIPFLWICIIGFAALKVMSRGAFPLWDYVRSVTLFPVGEVEPKTIWTLRHEFLFYAIFCLFMIKGNLNWKPLLLWFLAPVIWFTFNLNLLVSAGFFHLLLDFIFNRVNILFGLGFLIGILYLKGFINFKVNSRFGFLICILSVVPLLLVAYETSIGSFKSSYFIQILVAGILSFFMVIIGTSIKIDGELNLFNRLGLLLGNASYSIYLTHSGTVSAVLGIWSKRQINASPVALLIVTTIISCIVGIVVHLVVEKPLIKIIRLKFTKSYMKPIIDVETAK